MIARLTLLLLVLFSGLALAAADLPAAMVRIPAGIYRPGVAADSRAKETLVKSFALDILPVTNGDYLRFVQVNPVWQRSRVARGLADSLYLKHWAADLDLGTNAPVSAPVTFVSWFAAKAYAEWIGKRLPTLAEWEFVARASSIRPDGELDPAFKQEILNWYTSPAQKLSAVGQKEKNFWGVYDMHGLIWEWVFDFQLPAKSGKNGKASTPDRFCGAGAQNAADPTDFAMYMRFAVRDSLKPDYTVHNLGFRCAADLQ